VAALERAGYGRDRQRGSHAVLPHSATGRRVVVPRHVARHLKSGMVRRIMRDAGLTIDGFRELLR